MTHHTGRMAVEALHLAAAGWRIFPLAQTQPATPDWARDATTDHDTITRWWAETPAANIGIALPTGLIVIEISPSGGGTTSLAAHTARHGPLPETAVVITGRPDRASHIYLNTPTGNMAYGKPADGIRVLAGDRDYTIAPPSIDPDTGTEYVWFNPDTPIAEAPPWIVTALRRQPSQDAL